MSTLCRRRPFFSCAPVDHTRSLPTTCHTRSLSSDFDDSGYVVENPTDLSSLVVFEGSLTFRVFTVFEPFTFTAQHIVEDTTTGEAAIIDPVLDFDAASGRVKAESVKHLLKIVRQHNLHVKYLLETHVHADHLTAARELKHYFPDAQTAICEKVPLVQNIFRRLYNTPDISGKGAEFDLLLADGSQLTLGNSSLTVMCTPGHTPACMSFYLNDRCVFVGDTLFMPDSGTARCDFPGGSCSALWNSLQRLISLPPETVLFMCHDYGANDTRPFKWISTVQDQRQFNIHVGNHTTEEEFVETRSSRDATLAAPRLLHPSLQFNMRAGSPPPPEKAEAVGEDAFEARSYARIPLNLTNTHVHWKKDTEYE